MATVLVETKDYTNFQPISHSRFLWNITAGMFTPLERYQKQFPEIRLYSPRFKDPIYQPLVSELQDVYDPQAQVNTVVNAQYIPFESLSPQINRLGLTPEGQFVYLRLEEITPDIINLIVNGEIETLRQKFKVKEVKFGFFLETFTDLIKNNEKIIQDDLYLIQSDSNFITPGENIYIDKTAHIQQFVSLQAEIGPIVIDKGAVIRSFSTIDGPAYIGKNTLIDGAKIRSGTSIKHHCKIGGEVEASIIESYSNKHHEGFIGHSYMGSWVNIGAMATTSDLKNNYGEVRINTGSKTISTGTNKFGSVICDYTKVGIGLMLNTGTIIGIGCNLFMEAPPYPKYIPHFQWGLKNTYREDRWIEDIKIIMSRRQVELSDAKVEHLRKLYKSLIVHQQR